MGDVAVSALVRDVLRRLTDVAIQEFKLLRGLEDDVSALKVTFSHIQAVLQDAEVKQNKKKAIEDWLRRLRSASLEAENVLDEVSTDAMLQRLHVQRGIKYRVRAFFSSDHNLLLVRTRIAHKVKNIRTKLAEIDANKSKFELTPGSASVDVVVGDETSIRETSSLVGCLSEICGRDAEVETVIQKICNKDIVIHDADDVRVYAMWGMGGVGKTTLAQLVYNHESVKTHFGLKCWVYVSNVFNVKKVIGGILESIDGRKCELSQLDTMLVSLQNKLKEKRFLIVLDDVWNRDMTKWEELRKALCCGADGSVVMVTTRSQEISEMMVKYPEFRYAVGCLSEEDAWSLFKKHAFQSGRERGNIRELEPIGKTIVEKCKGLPLAVKALGGLMRSKNTVDEWLLVKNSEIWELQENDVAVFPALKLSYDNLTSDLKRCFAYCCLFPKGYEMEKNLLIEVWIANGFIPVVREADLYVVGEEIFNCLVRTSFFHDVREVENSMDQTFKMHDLVHDLARYVMRHDCSFIEPDKEKTTPNEVVHLRSSCPDFLFTDEGWEELRSLRSIFIFNDEYQGSVSQIFKHKYLRVLWLPRIAEKTLPTSICKLKHLRYLNMSGPNIEFLPELIIYLQNLQVLILTNCFRLRKLPEGMRYMRSLRHLDITSCFKLKCIPVPNLRRLSISSCNGLVSLPSNLPNLQRLYIYNCNGLVSLPSNLPNLQRLYIYNCKGLISLPSNLPNLQALDIYGCRYRLVSSPRNLPNLQDIYGCSYRLVSLPSNLPNLQTLNISRCNGLVSLPRNLPNIQTLNISDCNELVSLPSNLPNLQTLNISRCNRLVSLPSNLPNIQTLNISDCNELVSLPSNLPNLQTLNISSCHGLVSLPSNLPNLQTLNISCCIELVSLPSNLPNLQTLDIGYCRGLVSLPNELLILKELTIMGCDKLCIRYQKEMGEDWPKISHIPHIDIDDPWSKRRR